MISESKMKSMKRFRNKNYVVKEEVYNPMTESLWIDNVVTYLPNGPHAPNKQEAKTLRRICSQTGLNPEEVKEHKKYRKELSASAKSSHKSDKKVIGDFQRTLIKRLMYIRKSIARETGLCHHHPDFFQLFEKEWNMVYWKSPFCHIKSSHEAFSLIK